MRPSNTGRCVSMMISIIIGAVLYIAAIILDIAIWVHITSIFISLAIIEFIGNTWFPIDPKSKCLEKVDLNSAIAVFVIVFGPLATIFHLITSVLSIIKKRGSNASS